MSAAPPVRIQGVPDRFGWGFAAVWASLAAANLMTWLLSLGGGPAGLRAVAVTVAAGVAAAITWHLLARRVDAAGALTWDGRGWQWVPDAAAPLQGQVQVVIDLGPWLLLRLRAVAPARRACWLATSRRTEAGQWPVWRAALYAATAHTPVPAATGPT